jgi:hypothetical protein
MIQICTRCSPRLTLAAAVVEGRRDGYQNPRAILLKIESNMAED